MIDTGRTEFTLATNTLRLETLEKKTQSMDAKIDEMLDILKFWRRLMNIARAALTLLALGLGILHYLHMLPAWLYHLVGVSHTRE